MRPPFCLSRSLTVPTAHSVGAVATALTTTAPAKSTNRIPQLAIPNARNTTSATIIFTTISEDSTNAALRQRVERGREMELITTNRFSTTGSRTGHRRSGRALYAWIPAPINPYPAPWK